MTDYYQTCAFPKPGNTKKKKKQNGYKDKPNRICIYTGESGAERHEVFAGNNRQTSIDYGFQIDVCRAKHEELQDNKTPWAQEENKKWKSYFEKKYVEKLVDAGMDRKQALKMWMDLIGRNYVDEYQPE